MALQRLMQVVRVLWHFADALLWPAGVHCGKVLQRLMQAMRAPTLLAPCDSASLAQGVDLWLRAQPKPEKAKHQLPVSTGFQLSCSSLSSPEMLSTGFQRVLGSGSSVAPLCSALSLRRQSISCRCVLTRLQATASKSACLHPARLQASDLYSIHPHKAVCTVWLQSLAAFRTLQRWPSVHTLQMYIQM